MLAIENKLGSENYNIKGLNDHFQLEKRQHLLTKSPVVANNVSEYFSALPNSGKIGFKLCELKQVLQQLHGYICEVYYVPLDILS